MTFEDILQEFHKAFRLKAEKEGQLITPEAYQERMLAHFDLLKINVLSPMNSVIERVKSISPDIKLDGEMYSPEFIVEDKIYVITGIERYPSSDKVFVHFQEVGEGASRTVSFGELPVQVQEKICFQYSSEKGQSIFREWNLLSDADKKRLKAEMEERKFWLMKVIAEDKPLSVELQEVFQLFPSKDMLSEKTLLAFQLRFPDKLVFKNVEELEQAAFLVLKKHFKVKQLLSKDEEVFDAFKEATGQSVNEHLVEACKPYLAPGHFYNANPKAGEIMNDLDHVLANIKNYDVFQLMLLKQKIVNDLSVLDAKNFSATVEKQLGLLTEHINKAKQELLKWQKEDRRKGLRIIDKLIGRKQPEYEYKLPPTAILRTKEGELYINSLKLQQDKLTKKEYIEIEKARAALMLADAHGLKRDRIAQKKLLETAIELFQQYGVLKGLAENKLKKEEYTEGWMKLSDLRLDNIQDGEVRIVPSMSKSLIHSAQQLADIMVSPENIENVNPVGRNDGVKETTYKNSENRARLEQKNRRQFDNVWPKLISGNGKSKGTKQRMIGK